MTPCPRPLDPIDAEAVAAGEAPIFASDAAVHARECRACGARVEAASSLRASLEGASGPVGALSGLAGRVSRLRDFSRKERRTYALWSGPLLLSAGLAAAGIGALALPALAGAEQLSAGAAAAAPLLALVRTLSQSAVDLIARTPAGLRALSEGLRQESAIGLVALALLAPLSFGLRRVLARVPGRK